MEKEKAEKKELRFLGKVILFCIPLAIILGLPIWEMYAYGEFLPYNALVAKRMQGAPALINFGYSNPLYYLDRQAVVLGKPQVLVLGSSRVDQIRSDFFDSTTTEYTASVVVQDMDQFQQFLDSVPASSSPKVLVIGLDQKFFNPNYNVANFGASDIRPLLTQTTTPISAIFGNWWAHWFALYGYMASEAVTPENLIHPYNNLLGTQALVHRAGYRNDGSYEPGEEIHVTENPYSSYITQGTMGFEYSDSVSTSSLDELNSLLAECASRNIYVIGFVPPFSPTLSAQVNAMGNDYGYMRAIAPDVVPIFKKYGFGFYNFGDPQSLGITTADMRDEIHPTERGYLMMVEKMAESDKTLARYTNAAFLKNILSSTTAQDNIVGSQN
jgi:hypothetical protein